MRFCLCIFESDTVKSDCPVQIFKKMMKYLKITLLVLLFFWRYLKKKKKKKALKKKTTKKSSENDQSTGHFQKFLLYIFFRTPDPRSEKKSRKSTNKKIWPLLFCSVSKHNPLSGATRLIIVKLSLFYRKYVYDA